MAPNINIQQEQNPVILEQLVLKSQQVQVSGINVAQIQLPFTPEEDLNHKDINNGEVSQIWDMRDNKVSFLSLPSEISRIASLSIRTTSNDRQDINSDYSVALEVRKLKIEKKNGEGLESIMFSGW